MLWVSRVRDDCELLPTPTARDYKDVGDPQAAGIVRNAKRRLLAAVVLSRQDRHGGIDSRFVTRMMGYPDGWLELGKSRLGESPDAG